MDQSNSIERIPHLLVDRATAQDLIQEFGDTIYSEADTAVDAAGIGITATAAEVHLQTVDESGQVKQFFDQAKQSAQDKHSSEIADSQSEYDQALQALKERHAASVARIDESYALVNRTIGSREAKAKNFLRQRDDLSQALVGAWRTLKDYHQGVMEYSVRAASELEDVGRRLAFHDNESANLDREMKRIYDEYGACVVLMDTLRQKQVELMTKDASIDHQLSEDRQAISSMDPNPAVPFDPYASWDDSNNRWTEARQANLQEALNLSNQLTQLEQQNGTRYARVLEIRQRLEMLAEARPDLVQRTDELRGIIYEMYDLRSKLVEGVSSIEADAARFKELGRTIDERGNISPELQEWMNTTLAKYQTFSDGLPRIVEELPPTDPASLSGIQFAEGSDLISTPVAKAEAPAAHGSIQVEEIRDMVRNFLGKAKAEII